MSKQLSKQGWYFCLLFFLLGLAVQGQEARPLPTSNTYVGNQLEYLRNPSISNINELLADTSWKPVELEVANFDLTEDVIWLRGIFTAQQSGDYLLELGNPIIDSVKLFLRTNQGVWTTYAMGDRMAFENRPQNSIQFTVPFSIEAGETLELYARFHSSDQQLLPLRIGSQGDMISSISDRDLFFGGYIGIMLVMFLYNLFIYFTTRDKSYLYYILYILFLGAAQSSLQGFTFKYIWPDSPWLFNQSIIAFSALTGLAAFQFSVDFLQVKQQAPRFLIGVRFLQVLYLAAMLARLAGWNMISFRMTDIAGGLAVIYAMVYASVIASKGYRPAKFFLFAWTFFLVGLAIYVMRNFGVLPYNGFTNSSMQIGSAIEVILMSFALADRINILKKEKEASQAQALLALQENERIVREQNIILETKVEERTLELQEANEELKVTLDHLKETQSQLVDAEKMASLGQLTAGIAHEINNPINFVSSNINPLRRDFQDLMEVLEMYASIKGPEDLEKIKEIEALKQDIDYEYVVGEISDLISGIQDGANRTAEIVKGLRNFSRLDEEDFKEADLNEGIQSTLTILNNKVRDRIEVETDFGLIPMIECYPGKINQVFMNILSNAIQAIEDRMKSLEPEYAGKISVWTKKGQNEIVVGIKDNGPGMTDEVKRRIFEPFFTTKDVGEGTGLGLSIVFKILEKHQANIEVHSEVGVGTEFILHLPVKQEAPAEEE